MSDNWNPDDFRTPSMSGAAPGRKNVEELAKEFEDVVLSRLRKVERSNRRMRTWIMGLIGLNVVIGLGAAALLATMAKGGRPAWAAQTVSARRFVLSDARGRVRGTWSADDDGAVRWALSDSAGTERLRMSVLPEGGSPGMVMTDDAGNSRVALALLPDETSTLVFADRAGYARAVLGISNEATTLAFADRQGNTKAGIGIDATGRPDLLMDDSQPGETVADSVVADSTGN